MKYNSEYQYILMLLESVKPRVYGWTLLKSDRQGMSALVDMVYDMLREDQDIDLDMD